MSGVETYPCAYHKEQFITHFCRCSNCLLPVCSICRTLHTEQHSLSRTHPNFAYTISKNRLSSLIQDIKGSYSDLQVEVKEINSILLKIERHRKSNEAMLRQTLVHHRNILFEALEEALADLQKTIVLQIIQQDKSFIAQLLNLDAKIQQVVDYLQQQSENLTNKSALKQIIHFQSRGISQIRLLIDELRSQTAELQMRSVVVTVDEDYLRKAVAAVGKYMTLSITKIDNLK